MRADCVIGWVLTIAAPLRKSQAKTLADLVEAACHVGRATLSAIGRCLAGSATAKSRIQRTWRFCDNDRVHVADAMAGFVRRLTKKRKKALVGALEWHDIRALEPLLGAAV